MHVIRVRQAAPLYDHWVRVEFSNGLKRDVDLEPYLHGPIFEPLRADPKLFRALRVEGGTLTWPNGADIDPDVLCLSLKPAWQETETTDSDLQVA
jgi:hypothetical protein